MLEGARLKRQSPPADFAISIGASKRESRNRIRLYNACQGVEKAPEFTYHALSEEVMPPVTEMERGRATVITVDSKRFPQLAVLLAASILVACSNGKAPEAVPEPEVRETNQDDVAVERNSELRETQYSIAAGDCRIVWTVFDTELNRGVIRHRANCSLALSEQAPLVEKLLRKVISANGGATEFRTLDWGRLYPDGPKDETMAVRLALAAMRSADWDAAKGLPRNGDINRWARKVANDASIYQELRPVFLPSGLEIQLTAVEKVLVLQAGELPFYEDLRVNGVRAEDRVPFDFQAWFSLRTVGTERQ
jgi:hypothetical protein